MNLKEKVAEAFEQALGEGTSEGAKKGWETRRRLNKAYKDRIDRVRRDMEGTKDERAARREEYKRDYVPLRRRRESPSHKAYPREAGRKV